MTSLGAEQRTLVYRLQGEIHGQKLPDLTREQARETVLREQGRLPRFELGATEHDLSVDLRGLQNEGDPDYWAEAERQIEVRTRHIEDLRKEGNAGHISVFALARIPVLVMLGASLGDAADVAIYHRRNQEGWGWNGDAELPKFEVIEHRNLSPDAEVTLMCSLTASVQIDRAPGELEETNLYEIRPVGQEPGATLLDHPQALTAFANKYRELLSIIETVHPGAPSLNLLPAVPADAAIAVGHVCPGRRAGCTSARNRPLSTPGAAQHC